MERYKTLQDAGRSSVVTQMEKEWRKTGIVLDAGADSEREGNRRGLKRGNGMDGEVEGGKFERSGEVIDGNRTWMTIP